LTQIGSLKANTLSLTNTAGSTTLNNAGNAINVLGAINAAGQTFSLTDNVAGGLTQTGVLTASTLNLTNTSGNTDVSTQSNLISNLGTINAGTNTFLLNNAQSIGETGSITANSLFLEGNGTFNLNSGNNSVVTLAADTTGGNFTFTNIGALTVGMVNGANGIIDINNNVTLNTGNTLTLANNINVGTGVITLNTTTGGISQSSGALTANGLLLTGAGTDTMSDSSNAVGTIAADINGSLTYKDADTLTVGPVGGVNGITSSNNDVTLNAADDLIVGAINAGTTGNVMLKAKNGSILDDGIDTTWITANSITLNSNGDVGAFPSPSPRIDPDFLDIDAGVNSLTINAPNGDIYVNMVNGNFSTSQINSLTLNPTGTVVLGVSGGNLNVNSGIFSGINLDHLYLGGNNVSVSNNIGLTAGSGTAELGIYATGNINLASGVNTHLTAHGGDIEVDATYNGVSSNGSITTSNGSTANIDTANLALAASKGINITTNTTADANTNISASNNVSGGISINNTGDLTIANGSSYGAFYADGISNTPASVSDAVDVTANSVALAAPIASSGANVNLTATGGTIDDLTGASLVTGNDVTFDAVNGVGLTNPINTTANQLDAHVSGLDASIYLKNKNTVPGGVLLDNVTTNNGYISVTADGSIDVGTVNAGANNLDLGAINGVAGAIDDLTGGSSITGDNLVLEAVDGIGLTHAINTTAKIINADVSKSGGLINLNQTGDVILNFLSTNSGTINVNGTGVITATDVDSTFAGNSTGNDITLTSGGDLNVGTINAGTAGNVNLTAANNSILDNTSLVIGNLLTLKSATGIGNNAAINTIAHSIDANVSGTGPININNESTSIGGVLLDNLTTNNGDITVTTDGNINVGTVNAGSSDVTLEAINGSGGAIDDLTGSSLVTGNDVTLNAVNGIGVTNPINTTANQIDANVSATGPININNEGAPIGGVLLDNLTSNNGDITVTADGNINVGTINAGSDNVSLTSNGGAIDDLTGGSLITDNDLILDSVNGIGVTNPINTTANQIDANVSGSGPININNENTPVGGVLLDNLTTNNGDITVTADGNINVGTVNAGSDNVNLISNSGSIDDLTGSSLVTGNDVTLNAVNGIGVTNPINTTANQIDADVSGTGPININNENTSPGGVLLDSLTTNDGAITVTADGNINVGAVNAGFDNVSLTSNSGTIDDLTGASLITGNDLTLDSTNGMGVTNPINTTANQIDANVSSTGPININNESTPIGGVLLDSLTTNDGDITVTADGNINVGTVNAGNSNVNLTATGGGSILDDNSLITGNSLVLNASNDIGNSLAPIVINANFLSVNAGGLADLKTNNITLNSVSTGSDFTLEALTGDITLNGTIQSAAGAVDLTSDNGSINGDPGSILVAENDSTLSVPNGTIGLIDPVNVNIQGNLILDIGSEVGGNSGFLTGIVDSSASAVPLLSPANPPGDVYFNGIRFWPPVINNPGSSPNTPGISINDFFLLTQASSDLQKHFVFPDAEKLALTQVNTFDPSTSSAQSGGLFLYHPLIDLDSGAFDQEFQLDQGAYDFIDGQIEKKL